MEVLGFEVSFPDGFGEEQIGEEVYLVTYGGSGCPGRDRLHLSLSTCFTCRVEIRVWSAFPRLDIRSQDAIPFVNRWVCCCE